MKYGFKIINQRNDTVYEEHGYISENAAKKAGRQWRIEHGMFHCDVETAEENEKDEKK